MAAAARGLVARYDDLVEVVADSDHKLVFGCPSRLVGGHMFFGVHATGLFLRLGDDDAAELLAAGGGRFEPMPRRAMGGSTSCRRTCRTRRAGSAGPTSTPARCHRRRAAGHRPAESRVPASSGRGLCLRQRGPTHGRVEPTAG